MGCNTLSIVDGINSFIFKYWGHGGTIYVSNDNKYIFFLIFTKNAIVEFEMALSCGFRGNEFKKHLEMLK